jgi:hypothetical protein
MNRSLGAAALVLLLAACAAGLWWRGAHRDAPGAACPPPDPPPDPAALQAAAPVQAAAAPARPWRIELPSIADGASPAARRALVRVRGQVLKSGLLVRGCDLSFRAAAGRAREDEVEWDFTDRNGRYEVELPAAAYVVCSEDAAPWAVAILVPDDREELVLDLHLPP